MKERLERATNEEVSHGRLYLNLDMLVEENLLEKGDVDRRTNYYRLSDAGRRALRERREWEDQFP